MPLIRRSYVIRSSYLSPMAGGLADLSEILNLRVFDGVGGLSKNLVKL